MTISRADTIDLAEAARRTWDMVVIGAGPAGCAAALLAARLGARVLVIEKSRWPRDKVCGCCLSAGATRALGDLGLRGLPGQLAAPSLSRCRLRLNGHEFVFPLAGGHVLSRRALDAALLQTAVDAGAQVMTGTAATAWAAAGGTRMIGLRGLGGSTELRARCAIAADGLGGSFLRREPRLRPAVARRNRVGIATLAPASDLPAGEVCLAVGAGGYVGLVTLEDGRLNIAAALDPTVIQKEGGPGGAVAHILAAAKFPRIEASNLAWQGVPALRRCRGRLWGERVLLVGDAAGYVEPFTGQGIGWALQSAMLVGELLPVALEHWSAAVGRQWQARHAAIRRQQLLCRLVSNLVRWPGLLAVLLRGGRMTQPLVGRILHGLQMQRMGATAA